MSEQTAKPYLVRALYQWCTEASYTPYLVVMVNAKCKVPIAYVRDGQITLNVADTAVHKLTMDNEWVLFNARFNGLSQEVAVPMEAVIGLYARETGYGMGFAIPETVAATPVQPDLLNAVVSEPASEDAAPDGAPGATKPKSRNHLSVVK